MVSDMELVERYLSTREARAFEELIARHRARMLRLVVSILGPEHSRDAEDVLQEALIQALDRLPGFRGESKFGTWLYRVVYNRALDHQRSARRRLRRAGKSLEPTLSPGEDPLPGGDERLARRERDLVLHEAVARLGSPYSSVLRLFYWLDQPVAEIATTLGVAEGTVKSYLHRGRTKLARSLKEKGVEL